MALDLPGAGSLRFSLALAGRPAGGSAVLRGDGLEVELRVLEDAHQALVHGAPAPLCETVGRLEGADVPVPAWLERHDAAGRYVFRSSLERPGPEALRRRLETLRAEGDDDPGALLAVPGDGGEVAALACRLVPGGVAWTTWRAFPAAGELLVTRSRLLAA